MNKLFILIAASLFLYGCGKSDESANNLEKSYSEKSSGSVNSTVSDSEEESDVKTSVGGFEGRQGALSNPTDSNIVYLYHSLAGLAPPIEKWVETDSRVQQAAAPDRAARRLELKSEYELAAKSVGNIGTINVSLANADLSDYDPSYGEFSIGSLSPGSALTYQAFNQNIKVNFANGKTAQIWKVAPEDAQIIRDKRNGNSYLPIDIELKIVDVLPDNQGGTIIANIVQYEIRDGRTNTVIARNKVSIK